MRRTLLNTVLVLFVIVGFLGGYALGFRHADASSLNGDLRYREGYEQGVDEGIGIHRGAAVLGFSALEKLREGNADEAIQSLESLVFRSMLELDRNPRWREWTGFAAILPSVAEYRDVHLGPMPDGNVYAELNDLLARRISR